MTRTGLSPRLSQHRREPLVEIHPDDAAQFGLVENGLARVSTASGNSVFRVGIHNGQRRGEIFVPIHWTDQTASMGRTGRLPSRARDPISGQPGFKNTAAAIASVTPAWSGFLITESDPAVPACDHWTRIRTASGWLVELAGSGDPEALLALLPKGERAEVQDSRKGMMRAVVMEQGNIRAALFIARDNSLPSRDWLIGQLSAPQASPVELLAGRPAQPAPDRGPIVCVCFDVGMRTIVAAIAEHRLASIEAVGAALNAGTNCGSCRPAIASLLKAEKELIDG
jgi:assimilatory nitrate reductase catalytic subunit